MTKPLNATQAVIEWVNNTRRYATRLDDEADALLAQLTLAAADESALNAACASHGCVGLYGYAQSAKAHLLTTLCGNENGKLEIITPTVTMIISATSTRVMRQRIWLFALRATFFQTRAAGRCACA